MTLTPEALQDREAGPLEGAVVQRAGDITGPRLASTGAGDAGEAGADASAAAVASAAALPATPNTLERESVEHLAEVQDVSRHCSFQPAGVHDEARESDEPWWWRLETGDVIKLATGLVLSQ
jgi:hypothetical protein